MDNEFKRCNYCGEMFFTEDLDNDGKCKLCNKGHFRYDIVKSEDEDEYTD